LLIVAPVVGVTANVTGVPALVAFGVAVNADSANVLTVTVSAVAAEIVPEVAVTFAVFNVVRVVVALPLASLVAVVGVSVPLSVVKVTGTLGTGEPESSMTVALTVAEPPDDPSVAGEAESVIVLIAAVPTLIFVVVDAPPE
jgi:hypothetical protein